MKGKHSGGRMSKVASLRATFILSCYFLLSFLASSSNALPAPEEEKAAKVEVGVYMESYVSFFIISAVFAQQ